MIQAFVSGLLEMITGLGSGVPQVVVDIFQTLFFTTGTDGKVELTALAAVGIITVGSGLVMGLISRARKKATH